ncbi:DUF6665 family protein [Sphingosinicella sp. LY1275]|uniref:DUF6665 family protein n=1 Tax=Sphingosinicella sp. LY1275 TaxID=3095379 RepID=UPI002ADED2B9|nr:DUF6665 family protein [Sphingosinicella sp. LY1275]MEA1014687.1 DUF6665 family protein [Sphingosinicella sp. LY1275]
MRKAGEARHEAVEREILGEKAAALGRGGRRVEAALAALRNSAGEERERLIDEAARIVWGFLVQRELLGLRDRDRVIAHYAIPAEVLNRMGAIRT